MLKLTLFPAKNISPANSPIVQCIHLAKNCLWYYLMLRLCLCFGCLLFVCFLLNFYHSCLIHLHRGKKRTNTISCCMLNIVWKCQIPKPHLSYAGTNIYRWWNVMVPRFCFLYEGALAVKPNVVYSWTCCMFPHSHIKFQSLFPHQK